MPSMDELYTALRNADAAGDTAAATRLATHIRSTQSAAKASPGPQENGGGIAQGIGNLAAGALRGAGSIGATLLSPIDIAKDALAGKGLSLESNRRRRADIDGGLELLGAEPDSWMYQGGKLAGEIAGTAGAGGAVANGLRAVKSTPRAIALANAIASGGFRTGSAIGPGVGARAADLAMRSTGGAISGGVSAAAVNPDDIGVGAGIGAALPVVGAGMGATARAVSGAARSMTVPQEVRLANRLAELIGKPKDRLISGLAQQGPSMIPGYRPTVPQLVQSPALSQLQRTLHTANAMPLVEAAREQQAAYRRALDLIAPADISVRDAADRAGSAIEKAADKGMTASSKRVNRAFTEVDQFGEAKLHLPVPEMQDAIDQFLGPGTFGTGSKARDALATAEGLGKFPATVDFRTLQNLRSSIGEAWSVAKEKGSNKEAGALNQMITEIDDAVSRAAGGSLGRREHFPRDMADRYRDARALHEAKVKQFETGPQVGMFRMGGDGQAALQGGEIPRKFYNGNASQVEDMQAFKRLTSGDPMLTGELKRYAMTEGQSTANLQGDLTSKFNDWMVSRSGANRELLAPNELATLNEVGKAVQLSTRAESLGRVSGPDTAQKIEAIKNLGALDNKLVNVLATRIPFVGRFTGPMLDGLRATAETTRNNKLAELLADPERLAKALDQPGPQRNVLVEMIKTSLPMAYRAAPVIGAQ